MCLDTSHKMIMKQVRHRELIQPVFYHTCVMLYGLEAGSHTSMGFSVWSPDLCKDTG